MGWRVSRAAVADIEERLGPLEILVNNAGMQRRGPLGTVFGKRVLVTGCGPIGSLRAAGAGEIVAVDLSASALACAENMGATRTHNLVARSASIRSSPKRWTCSIARSWMCAR